MRARAPEKKKARAHLTQLKKKGKPATTNLAFLDIAGKLLGTCFTLAAWVSPGRVSPTPRFLLSFSRRAPIKKQINSKLTQAFGNRNTPRCQESIVK